ncbi:MAG: chemotaxis protein CheA [Melioribacteraceae bacterium]
MIDAHRKAFIEEATELLSELESTLLEVEERPDDKELIAKIFRALHTIKGSSGMFGYDDITMFTHDIENVYDRIRNGEIGITKVIIDLTLAARDQISLMLIHSDDKSKLDESATKDILVAFRSIVNDYNAKASKEAPVEVKIDKTKKEVVRAEEKIFLVQFTPSQDIFMSGTNPVNLLKEMCELGNSIVLSSLNEVPTLREIEPEKCYTAWTVVLKTTKGIDAIKDVFIFVDDQCEIKIKEVETKEVLKDEEGFAQFDIVLKKSNLFGISEVETLINKFEKSADVKLEDKENKSGVKKVRESGETHHEADTASSIRVSAEKLDELVNLVGELVTIQARLSQLAVTNNDADMISVSEEVERITWSLRDSALNIRMLPIGTTFSKFKRLVRDLSKELGKEVELTTEGAETELDKTVIEKLNDPLIHIIRNSIDHGVESPEERIAAGKSSSGFVHLSASQSGGSVLIRITDDGAGLDKDAIKAKAIANGLISENAELSESEIYSLIFAPGFSTAKKVTNVSGRGVGMDVVKRAIDVLRGTVEVNSELGTGTTITLKLPLTLAIIDGLLVKIEDDHYVLPLSSVEECLELSQEDIDRTHGRHIVNVRGGIVPYISLRERFEITSNRPKIEQIVVAKINEHRVGFVVDQVFGQHQTVLKTLGNFYKNVEGVSGATILGDGTVALILDIRKIMEREELLENEA